MTPSGIEPATFRFVAQHLNHCVTAVASVVRTHVHFWRKDIYNQGRHTPTDYSLHFSIIIIVTLIIIIIITNYNWIVTGLR